MKNVWKVFMMFLGLSAAANANAQADELAQLALNIEKLAQFKQILKDLESGYEILTKGYNTIKNVSEGNFNLHKVFLDGLMAVNPAISNYKRVPDIIDYELRIVKEYKRALNQFRTSDCFLSAELDYISNVYSNLVSQSLANLEDLMTVITASNLRMSDDERLTSIDNIYTDIQDKWIFLQSFNSSTSILALQRKKEKADAERLRLMYDIKQ